jgi:hypothetical protein
MSCDTLQVMKFDDYNLMTDLGAGLFLLLIMVVMPVALVKTIALKLSTKFIKERDMHEGSAIRPTWVKIYTFGLSIFATFLRSGIRAGATEVRALPVSDSIQPGTYSADTPPPRNTSTAD